MFNFWKNLFCFAFMPLYFGGSGGSSSSTTTTNNTSIQAGIGDGAIGVFGQGNSLSVTNNTSDYGAIHDAFSFGKDALQASTKNNKDFLDSGNSLFKMSTDANSSNYEKLLSTTSGGFNNLMSFGREAVSGALSSISDSQKNVAALLDTAQSKGTMDNRTMIMLGGGALLVVAVVAWRSKK